MSKPKENEISKSMGGALPAIQALKLFTASTQGFAKRERNHVIEFINSNIDISAYSAEDIEDWLYQIWVGDYYRVRDGDLKEADALVKLIPVVYLPSCKKTALMIAKRSGRKPIDKDIMKIIDSLFSRIPANEGGK